MVDKKWVLDSEEQRGERVPFCSNLVEREGGNWLVVENRHGELRADSVVKLLVSDLVGNLVTSFLVAKLVADLVAVLVAD